MHKVGVDLGGTKIEAILLDEELQASRRRRIKTPESYDGILSSVAGLVADVAAGIRDYTFGICTPGTIDDGRIKNSNTQCLIGEAVQSDLQDRLGTKVSIENDANCFAMAEATIGAAAQYGVVFGVILGTGVGGGIIMNKELHKGRNGIAGEWGHHILHQDGNPCYCGKNGCVEAYISGPALEARWTTLSGRTAALMDILLDSSAATAQLKKEFTKDLGLALANVINILDPDVIVLGGGLSNIGFIYTDAAESMRQKTFSQVDTPVIQNKLGDSAGVFGAALL